MDITSCQLVDFIKIIGLQMFIHFFKKFKTVLILEKSFVE